jgi:sulfate transport system ATP-binding protein
VLVTHDQEEAMEVASRIVVMNHARVEQVGSPADLYDRPASDFVMGFVGRVNRLPEAFIRPHEVRLCDPHEPGCDPATVERLLALGFETRVELRRLRDGQRLWAQLTPAELAAAPLEPGQRVGVDLSRARPVAAAAEPVAIPA